MYERSYQAKVLKADSASSKRAEENLSPEEKKKKIKKEYFAISWWRVFWIFIIGSILVGIFILIRLPYFQITTVLVEGTTVVDQRDVIDFVNKQLQGDYLKVFPKSSLFLFSTKRSENNLKKQFSRIENIQVKKTNNHTLSINVGEYKGMYVWCDSDQSCFFMDEDGDVFAPAPIFSGNVYVKIFGGAKGEFPFMPLSKDTISNVNSLITYLDKISIKPNSFNFVDEHTLEIVFTHNGRDAKILIDPSLSFDFSYQSFISALKAPEFKNSFDAQDKYLEYIDLRFSRKIVYKFN